jgi:hypothetical protein
MDQGSGSTRPGWMRREGAREDVVQGVYRRAIGRPYDPSAACPCDAFSSITRNAYCACPLQSFNHTSPPERNSRQRLALPTLLRSNNPRHG